MAAYMAAQLSGRVMMLQADRGGRAPRAQTSHSHRRPSGRADTPQHSMCTQARHASHCTIGLSGVSSASRHTWHSPSGQAGGATCLTPSGSCCIPASAAALARLSASVCSQHVARALSRFTCTPASMVVATGQPHAILAALESWRRQPGHIAASDGMIQPSSVCQ